MELPPTIIGELPTIVEDEYAFTALHLFGEARAPAQEART